MKAADKKLHILWLWPDILNQHGDRGNVMALARTCRLYGIETNITRLNRLSDVFRPDAADLILLGAGELAVMPQIVGALSRNFGALKAWAESGGVLFATGATGAALGVHTERADGSHLYGLGLLDMECREREAVLGDDLVFRVVDAGAGSAIAEAGAGAGRAMAEASAGAGAADYAICGLQIHMADITLAEGQAPFGEVIYGYGNNGGKAEGAVKGGVFFTNALGPVLVKNPWLTIDIINQALKRRGKIGPLLFDPGLFGLELASAKAIRAFNENKEKAKWLRT